MVERRDEPDRLAAQHPVAEDVAGHVADAGAGERLRLHVEAEVAEVVADALPGAARRDPLALVVVAVAAAGSERVAEPEAVLRRHRVGRVRQVRRALVGRDDEVGIVVIVADDFGRMRDLRRARGCR